MAKNKRKAFENRKEVDSLNFTKANVVIFVIALIDLIIGYILLKQGPYNSFSSMTLAPIVLGIGYLVLLPLSILWNKS